MVTGTLGAKILRSLNLQLSLTEDMLQPWRWEATAMSSNPQPDDDPAPALTVETAFVSGIFGAYLATMRPKRARALLVSVTAEFARRESLALTLPLRSSSLTVANARAEREAVALYRALLPSFLARLPK